MNHNAADMDENYNTRSPKTNRKDYLEEDVIRDGNNSETEEPLDDVKNIVVSKNGDRFSVPKKVVVNRRQIRTWDAFLEDLTLTLKPIHGAIRGIHTPVHGSRVRALEDLRPQGRYIAVSYGERLKLMGSTQGLLDVSPSKRPNLNYNGIRLDPIKPVSHSSLKTESRLYQVSQNKRKIIHTYRNGDPFGRPINVLITHFEQKDMEFVMRAIEERVILTSNKAIRKIYTMQGKRIMNPEDLEDGESYVVAGTEPFTQCNYGHQVPHLILGSKVDRSQYENVKYLSQRPTPPKDKQRTPRSTNDISQTTSGDSDKRKKEEVSIASRTRSEDRVAFAIRKRPPMNAAAGTSKSNVTTSCRSKMSPAAARSKANLTERKPAPDPKPIRKPQNPAAAKEIQSAFRGYETRRDLADKKAAAAPARKPGSNATPPGANSQTNQKPEVNGTKTVADKKITPPAGPAESKSEVNPHGEDPKKEEDNADKRAVTPASSPVPPEEQTNDEEINEAASQIQAAIHGYNTRKEIAQQQGQQEEDKQEEDEAAVKIQAAFRGHQTRKKILEEKKMKNDAVYNAEADQAAVKIQAGFRGYKTRKEIHQTRAEQDAAASKIQASFRGYQTRKELAHIRTEEEAAATKIQSSFRGYKTRKEIIQSKEEQERAAIKIQAAVRGYQTRKEVKAQKQAAVTIQSHFKGYQVRKKMVDKKPQPEAEEFVEGAHQAVP